jgi:ABC-type arginine transport system ATPase subunit
MAWSRRLATDCWWTTSTSAFQQVGGWVGGYMSCQCSAAVATACGPESHVLALLCVWPAGAVVGIIGGNGAGKSTLFRMIMGAEQPDSGTVSQGDTVVPMYVDQSRETLDANRTVRMRFGCAAQRQQLYLVTCMEEQPPGLHA